MRMKGHYNIFLLSEHQISNQKGNPSAHTSASYGKRHFIQTVRMLFKSNTLSKYLTNLRFGIKRRSANCGTRNNPLVPIILQNMAEDIQISNTCRRSLYRTTSHQCRYCNMRFEIRNKERSTLFSEKSIRIFDYLPIAAFVRSDSFKHSIDFHPGDMFFYCFWGYTYPFGKGNRAECVVLRK